MILLSSAGQNEQVVHFTDFKQDITYRIVQK